MLLQYKLRPDRVPIGRGTRQPPPAQPPSHDSSPASPDIGQTAGNIRSLLAMLPCKFARRILLRADAYLLHPVEGVDLTLSTV